MLCQAKLAARRARKTAEALRKAQERSDKALEEEEKERLKKLREQQEEEKRKRDQNDGLVIPEIKAEENYEEQVTRPAFIV